MNTNYYVLFESWKMDSNQWSIFSGLAGIILTLSGFAIALYIYCKQRKDNAQDAFDFFQLSLPQLKSAIESTTESIEIFINSLKDKNHSFTRPILSASLNDKFINKINIVDLNRFYIKKRNQKHKIFLEFLKNTNFFGDYHTYFNNELSYFRNTYFVKEQVYNKWQLLRSNKFFSTISDVNETSEYKIFYSTWVTNLNNDNEVFETNGDGQPIALKNRTYLIENHIKSLAQDIFPHIQYSEKANEVNLIANEVIAAFDDMEKFRESIINTLEEDLGKFNDTLKNIKNIIE